MTRQMVLFGLILLVWAGSGCKCNKSDFSKAVNKFKGFAQGTDYAEEAVKTRAKKYILRKKIIETHRGRERVLADIEIDPAITSKKLEKILRDACHDDDIMGRSIVIKVRAWPGKLGSLVLPIGTSVFARDGHGWEGSGVGFETILVNLPSLSKLAQSGTAPVTEDEYLRLLAVENLMRRGMSVDEAINAAADRHGQPADDVRSTILHVQKVWGKPAEK